MSVSVSDTRVDQELDLRGEVCPYTFVRSKLCLEDLEVGEVLRVVLDHLPAVDNVPRSFSNEGHEVLGVQQVNDDDWHVVVRKVHE